MAKKQVRKPKKKLKEIDSGQLWRFPKGRLATKLLLTYS